VVRSREEEDEDYEENKDNEDDDDEYDENLFQTSHKLTLPISI